MSAHSAYTRNRCRMKLKEKEMCPIHTSPGGREKAVGSGYPRAPTHWPAHPHRAPAPRTEGWAPCPTHGYFWKLVPSASPPDSLGLVPQVCGPVGSADSRAKLRGTGPSCAAEPLPPPARIESGEAPDFCHWGLWAGGTLACLSAVSWSLGDTTVTALCPKGVKQQDVPDPATQELLI